MPKSSIMARGIARAETVVSEEATEGSLIQASPGIQPVLEQLNDPLRVAHVGLAARDRLNVAPRTGRLARHRRRRCWQIGGRRETGCP